MTECRHGLSEDCPGCMQETIDAMVTALRRIRSLDEKNVPKYAQQIASEALRDRAQRAPLFPMAACENIANEEFDRQVKIIESATNDKALSETGRASICAVADASALTAQRIASRIRSLAALTSTERLPTKGTDQ